MIKSHQELFDAYLETRLALSAETCGDIGKRARELRQWSIEYAKRHGLAQKKDWTTYIIEQCETCWTECGLPCAVCGEYVCGKCAGDGTEDGQLCRPCSEKFEMSEPEGGGVEVVDKKTKESAPAPYL